ITHLGGLPLSIILAGQTVASESQAGFSVANALQELLDRGGSMEGKGGAGREVDSLRAMLSVSYDHLPDERVRQAFRSLAVFGARPRTFAIEAAAHVWKVDSRTAQKQMVTLVNQQMVEPLGEGVFALHNAFASFATTLLVEHAELEALQEAHIHYYLELAQTYATADWRQVEKNIDQIRQAFQLVRREGDYHVIVDYLMAMNSYFSRRGLWHELLQWTEIALAAVQSEGNQRLEGILYSNMGAIYQQQSELDRALSAYKQSSHLLETADDQDGLAVVLNNMGAIYARLDLLEEAFDAYDQGQKILEKSEDHAGQAALATMLNNIGTLYQRQETWFEALEYYQLAYRFYEALQDHVGLANTLNHIGTVYSGQQRFEDALIQFERSQSLFNEAGDLVGESTSLYNMALIYEDLNRLEAAERAMGRLVEIEEQLNHPDLIEDRQTLQRLRHMLGISVEEDQVDQ
ncbi:MAG: tetratricopeptide repeat protein, partial [Anaerolineales bacterium]|nr:tetratricopeptide repeat protein [Anaerolineales bacterium]